MYPKMYPKRMQQSRKTCGLNCPGALCHSCFLVSRIPAGRSPSKPRNGKNTKNKNKNNIKKNMKNRNSENHFSPMLGPFGLHLGLQNRSKSTPKSLAFCMCSNICPRRFSPSVFWVMRSLPQEFLKCKK